VTSQHHHRRQRRNQHRQTKDQPKAFAYGSPVVAQVNLLVIAGHRRVSRVAVHHWLGNGVGRAQGEGSFNSLSHD
jgi:hypothetical protein